MTCVVWVSEMKEPCYLASPVICRPASYKPSESFFVVQRTAFGGLYSALASTVDHYGLLTVSHGRCRSERVPDFSEFLFFSLHPTVSVFELFTASR